MTAALSDRPPVGGWTTDDLDALPDDGVRRELIDGALHVSPSPSIPHQIIAARLLVALEQRCPEHYLVSQANDVRLGARRQFVPDVLVTTFAAAQAGNTLAATDVVLAVEIVSPSSQSMDRVLKPALYAKAGIPFYWMIETDGGITVHTYRLDVTDEVYQPSGTFTDAIKLDEPWRIEIPIAGLRPRNL
jgi:Uma2 family endonuclease